MAAPPETSGKEAPDQLFVHRDTKSMADLRLEILSSFLIHHLNYKCRPLLGENKTKPKQKQTPKNPSPPQTPTK